MTICSLLLETVRTWHLSVENHLPVFLPAFELVQIFLEYVGFALRLDFAVQDRVILKQSHLRHNVLGRVVDVG